MITDKFIEIGSQHQMCEDYIISGDNYIILADGCSSSDHSEMGARFLCYMAKEFMKRYGVEPLESGFAERMGTWIIHNAEVLIRQLGLKKTSLDSTLIVAYEKDGIIFAHMFGDGCIVIEPIEDVFTHKIFSVDYKAGSKSMPFYLRYLIDRDGHKLYHDAKVTKTVFKSALYENDKPCHKEPQEYAYDEPITFAFPVTEYKSISITSDGLSTFLKPAPDETGNKIMKVEEMVPFMFNFESSAGVFLQREMNICKRQLKKIGLEFDHFDDLSIGTFHMEETPNDKNSETE